MSRLPPTTAALAAVLGRPARVAAPPDALADVSPADPFERRLAVAAVFAEQGLPERAFELLKPGGAPPKFVDAWFRLTVVVGVAAGRLPEVLSLIETTQTRSPRGHALVVEALATTGVDALVEPHLPAPDALQGDSGVALSIASSAVRAGFPERAGPYLERAAAASHSSAELAVDTAQVAIRAGHFDLARRLLARADLPERAALPRARLALWAAQEPQEPFSASLSPLDRERLQAGHAVLQKRWDDVLKVATNERDPESLCFRAEALFALGRMDEAWSAARRGSELASDAYVGGRVLEALVAIVSGRERGLSHDGFNGLFDDQVDRVVPELRTLATAPGLVEPRLAEVARLLKDVLLPALGGNRDPDRPTFLRDGVLQPLQLRPGVRIEARRAQALLCWAGREASVQAFEALASARPRDPETWCYRGEIYLWLGEWAEARASFGKALEIRHSTRWAWIGRGATELMEGEPEQALATFAEGLVASGIPTPGPTMYVYRGEAKLRLGRLDDARQDLETSVRNAPTRIGAWLLLAKLHARNGDTANEKRCLLEVVDRARLLLLESAEVAGRPCVELLATPDGRQSLVDAALGLLRGNRASARVTWGRPGEPLKTMPVGDALAPWVPSTAELVTLLQSAK